MEDNTIKLITIGNKVYELHDIQSREENNSQQKTIDEHTEQINTLTDTATKMVEASNETKTKVDQIFVSVETVKNDVATLESSIDNLSEVVEERATAVTELQDIRVGADGATYDSAGAAIRTQFTNMQMNHSADIDALKGDLSSVGQQADANKEEIANLTSSVNEKFLSSGLGILRTGKLYGTKVWKSAVNNSQL